MGFMGFIKRPAPCPTPNPTNTRPRSYLPFRCRQLGSSQRRQPHPTTSYPNPRLPSPSKQALPICSPQLQHTAQVAPCKHNIAVSTLWGKADHNTSHSDKPRRSSCSDRAVMTAAPRGTEQHQVAPGGAKLQMTSSCPHHSQPHLRRTPEPACPWTPLMPHQRS